MAKTLLARVRQELGHSQDAVIRLLLARADATNAAIATGRSLKTKLSRWENGHETPAPYYQALFRDVYGRTNEELGFPAAVEEIDDAATELADRLIVAQRIDPETVELFRRQVDNARHMDQRFGSVALLDQLRSQIGQIEDLLSHALLSSQRAPLAATLTEASTLAGWTSLDRRATQQAWQHYERAKAAAREAGSPSLLAHAQAEQAMVLVEIDQTHDAVGLVSEAVELGRTTTAPLLRAWLAATLGEVLAADGRRDDALRAFDQADELLPADPRDPALPFVFLGGTHLARWRGSAIARLGEPDAITQLTDALDGHPATFSRARASLLVDLAHAHGATGDRDAALSYAGQARRLAAQISSERQKRRLKRLTLPGTSILGA
ncbi:hypothetical protein [Actinoalloteichus hymeniacidonis]|uniref:HTH cro/C1-type domain-containing protein n=1 Tax=Actinoalloteichus hymeniacidonis TaxID=340345 RepID=A0AAC9HP37_9PSEU|nr:hypothetical protein [Actinoalloteichus hymeniacidonis]AOS62838.1 hypothetical protein TL08_10115 [Actinoalloteichus hymeniacidonis]MBB5909129.1 tetratricopeptide (TPR) repeat protein [Actinoalloteichus hymeniacidonis]